MVEDVVEKKLEGFLGDLETQIRSCLEWCNSPAAKLLLLEFLQLPGAQPSWRRLESDPSLPSGLSKTAALSADDGRPGSPTGLVWLDSWTHYVVYDHERRSQCCRLIPKFQVLDESGVPTFVDFAIFWPRFDGNGHFKIAIQCDADPDHKTVAEFQKCKRLEKQGWIVMHISIQDIRKDPMKIIEQVREIALEENTRFAKERRTGH